MSYVLSVAKKLESQLLTACKEFHHSSEESYCAFESQQTAFTHLAHLKKVCKRVHFEGWKQVEQSLHKLKTEEAKIGSNPAKMETTGTPVMESLFLVVHLSLLADPFLFNSSFS